LQPGDDEAPASRGDRIFQVPARARGRALKHLIVTADDFGLAPEVNAAVELAHRDGILTAASLMVAAPAAADAVARARRLPALRTGLHLVLVDGTPALPPDELPNLVDADGRLRLDMVRLGLEICARPSVRAQLRAEIEAQFRAYQVTGLALDHVNAHKHFHLHPAVANEVISVGLRHGMRALRVPHEPAAVLAKVEAVRASPDFIAPWTRLLARRVRRAELRAPDNVFGLAWSGAMSVARLNGLLSHLPAGCTEIYLHPATRDGFTNCAPDYRYADELAALIDASVIASARRSDVVLGGYGDAGRPLSRYPLS
jgi:hopanoid biosynthesis associated protein HpnK